VPFGNLINVTIGEIYSAVGDLHADPSSPSRVTPHFTTPISLAIPPHLPHKMSVEFQLILFATVCTISGFALLINPSLLLNSPLEPHIVRLTGLPSTVPDPATLAPAGIAILAIGAINFCAVYSGDDKFAQFVGMVLAMVLMVVWGRLVFAALEAGLLVFTDRGSTGLLIMLVCDLGFALWLGSTIGFGFVERGKMKDLTKKKQK